MERREFRLSSRPDALPGQVRRICHRVLPPPPRFRKARAPPITTGPIFIRNPLLSADNASSSPNPPCHTRRRRLSSNRAHSPNRIRAPPHVPRRNRRHLVLHRIGNARVHSRQRDRICLGLPHLPPIGSDQPDLFPPRPHQHLSTPAPLRPFPPGRVHSYRNHPLRVNLVRHFCRSFPSSRAGGDRPHCVICRHRRRDLRLATARSPPPPRGREEQTARGGLFAFRGSN